jgi:ABC-type phosphate/phosphonate transport system substrate-binding protein
MSRIRRPTQSRSSARIKVWSQRTRIAQRNLTFGLYLLDQKRNIGPTLDVFCKWIGDRVGVKLVPEQVSNYEMLAEKVRREGVDLAWLPPVVYLRAGVESLFPLLSLQRGGTEGGYETALIVREDSPARVVEDLHEASVAWVDEWSAAGYVIPRLSLRLGGVDPSRLFRTEAFYGTHSAAVAAVVRGEVDVCATYARTDGHGRAVEGAWSDMPGARVRSLMTFGEIPPDVIAATRGVPEDIRVTVRLMLEAAARSRSLRPMLKGIFGADAFGPVVPSRYDGLRAALVAEEPPASER